MTREELIKKLEHYRYCLKFQYGWYSKDDDEAFDMAIKALEQQTCEDCISRQAVLEAFGLSEKSRKYGGDHSGYDTLMKYEIQDILEDLPSVTPQPNKWIPVSERLPEESGMYLCSYDDDDVGTSYFDISMNEFNMLHEQVTAWMYIPEPYKQEVEG